MQATYLVPWIIVVYRPTPLYLYLCSGSSRQPCGTQGLTARSHGRTVAWWHGRMVARSHGGTVPGLYLCAMSPARGCMPSFGSTLEWWNHGCIACRSAGRAD
ncbi:hypothetical protein ACN38_g6536 [Penicillium nordicum]|uniref:Uncharacterized protein n=1 Tax=Penicillium nordicum TaxID=229535 RepID=A0A0N0RYT0_9EURO|nr:hypothetical protein ACN38_g6536 [Penicillium nordicum]